MGGRGGSSGMADGGGKFTTSDKTVKDIGPQIFKDQDRYGVYDVKAGKNGEIILSEAKKRDTGEGSRKYPVYEYETKGAYINVGDDSYSPGSPRATRTEGVDFEKVKSVSGYTFTVKEYLKKQGFKWDRGSQKWVK